MRSSATCRRLQLFLLLLVLSLMSGGAPIAQAQMPRVGEIALTPTHAVPGTLVSFQGVGWYVMPYPSIGPYFHCQVNGVPVKIDRYCICEVLLHEGIYEPAGTFVVADVPAGDYPIFIDILEPTPSGAYLIGKTMFTVEPVTAATSVVTSRVATSVTSHTSILTTSLSVTSLLTVTATVTTTKTESPSTQQLPDYIAVLAPSIVTVCLVVIVAVVLLRKGAKHSGE